MNSERQPSTNDTPGTPGDIGDLLRASRLRQGHELAEVAQALRIRAPYLQAIEDGRYENLPGPAYAVGFIRTYANYLGLDGEQIVNRFKNEASGQGRKVDLNFPAAVPADGIPRGAVVTVGLLVLIAAYGGWYVLSSKEVFRADDVPPVPQAISRAADAPASAVAAEPRVAPTERTPALVPPPAVTTPAPADAKAAAPALPAPVASTPVPPPAANPAAAVSSDDDEADSTPPPSPAAAAAPTAAAAPARSAAEAAMPDQSALDDRGGVDSPAAGSQLAALADATDDPSSRIVLKADLDSWIEVRDQDKRLLVTRLLRKGDSYTVPRREGLMLVTGNAGGLTITVGGESVPSLGPVGLVRRNVMLDPQKLRAGLAVVE